MPTTRKSADDGRSGGLQIERAAPLWMTRTSSGGAEGDERVAARRKLTDAAQAVQSLRRENRRLLRQARTWKRAHEELRLELAYAEKVQRALLPRVLPRPPGVEFGAGLRPVEHLAGDFYNVFRLDEDRVGCYLGDVVGHGAGAALLSVFVMQSIRAKRIEGTHYEIVPPSLVMEQLNRDMLAANFPNESFLTMVYGILDTRRRTWTYCGCGHPPALLLRRGEGTHLLDSTAPLLGVYEAPFEETEVALRGEDLLVLYSDGGAGARWGTAGQGLEGMAATLSNRAGCSPQETVDAAMATVSFTDVPSDDVALLVARLDA